MTTQPPPSPDSAPSSLIAPIDYDDRRSQWFFLRRIPRRRIPRDWTRPPDEQYEHDLEHEGFIAPSLLGEAISAELAEDLRELDQHLLPHFWRMNQQAKFYQNRFYQYQWAFILAAFLTTALGAVNVFLYAQEWTGRHGTIVGTLQWTELLGFLTAVISGIAAAVSFLDANQTPQKRWFKARVQAETLRSMYFLFLARQAPFNSPGQRERVQRMREKVIEVLRETHLLERPQSQGATAPTPAPAEPEPAPRRLRRPSTPDTD